MNTSHHSGISTKYTVTTQFYGWPKQRRKQLELSLLKRQITNARCLLPVVRMDTSAQIFSIFSLIQNCYRSWNIQNGYTIRNKLFNKRQIHTQKLNNLNSAKKTFNLYIYHSRTFLEIRLNMTSKVRLWSGQGWAYTNKTDLLPSVFLLIQKV